MLQPVDKAPLKVDLQPQIGPVLLSVDYLPTGAGMDAVQEPPATKPVTLDDLLIAVLYLRTDIQILRAELASRTLGARLRRLWKGLRTWFARWG